MAGAADRVRAMVEPILTDLEVDLYDLELTGGEIRLTIDRVGGVDMGIITRVTRMLMRELEHTEGPLAEMGLEVSSPGIERNLRTPDHYRRAVGELVSVKTLPHVEGERRVQGIVTGADADGVNIGERRIPYDDIDKARTVFEWGPAPKPGKAPSKRPASDKSVATATAQTEEMEP